MAAKTLVQKQKSVAFVHSAATTYRERIAEQVAAEFPGHDREKVRDALLVFVDAIAVTGKERFTAYEVAETSLAEERGDDPQISAERNEAGARVVSLLVEVRKAARNTDPALARRLGFQGKTPRHFDSALVTGKYVVSQLAGMEKVPSTVMRGFVFDPAQYADLAQAVARLAKAQTAWIADGHQNDAAMVDRDRVEKRNDRSLSLASALISALLKAAGEDLLASRVGAPGRNPGIIAEFESHEAPKPSPVLS